MITKKDVFGSAHIATRFELSTGEMFAVNHLRNAINSNAKLNSDNKVELAIDQNDYCCLFELLTVLSDVNRTVAQGMFAGAENLESDDSYTPNLFKKLPKDESATQDEQDFLQPTAAPADPEPEAAPEPNSVPML